MFLSFAEAAEKFDMTLTRRNKGDSKQAIKNGGSSKKTLFNSLKKINTRVYVCFLADLWYVWCWSW